MHGALRIGMAQMRVAPGDPAANLRAAAGYVADAARAGCEVVVLPECLDLGWIDPSSPSMAAPIPGPRSAAIAAAARRHRLFVAAGLVERSPAGSLHNTAILADPSGATLLRHGKVHEVGDGLELYRAGATADVAATPFGRVGLAICADNLDPSLSVAARLAGRGAQLLLSPSAWAVPADHDEASSEYGDEWLEAYGEIAKRFGMATVGVSYVGRLRGGAWDGWRVIGRSLAMGADGRVLARGPYDEPALVIAEVPVPGLAEVAG